MWTKINLVSALYEVYSLGVLIFVISVNQAEGRNYFPIFPKADTGTREVNSCVQLDLNPGSLSSDLTHLVQH